MDDFEEYKKITLSVDVWRPFAKFLDWRQCAAVNAEGGGYCYAKL
jgi:hypothetical protein